MRSEFFYYHMIHDRPQCHIAHEQLLGGLTHAQELARHMARLIDSDNALHCALDRMDRAWQLKDRFYRQFICPASGLPRAWATGSSSPC